MVRLVHFLRRQAGLTLSQFSAHWRDVHGPLVASHQTRLGILRYSQMHRDLAAEQSDLQARAARKSMEPPYDGVADLWWPSEAALQAAAASAAGRAAGTELLGDMGSFVDLPSSPFWLAHEYPQISVQRERPVARPKTGIIKVCFPLRARAGLSEAQAKHYWRTVHGPLVRSHAVARGMIGYQQVHRCHSDLIEDLRVRRGSVAEPYIGHAEAWFDRLTPRVGPEASDAATAALADEVNFIDWQRSTLFSGKELLFVDRDWL